MEHPPPPSSSTSAQNLFNLRSSKSEYYLPAPQQTATAAFYQRPAMDNIDDDTKWITSSASTTASYHSDELDEDRGFGGGGAGDHQPHSPVYAEIVVKPVSIGSLPPLDRGLPYRNYSRFVGGNYNNVVGGGDAGSRHKQTSVVGDNLPNGCGGGVGGVRKAQTPPMLLPSSHTNESSTTNWQQQNQHQPRKYFTLNPRNRPTDHQQRIDRHFHTNGGGGLNYEDRRRSMTPTTATISEAVVPTHYSSQQALLNRSQSCYVDPLDYKVGCQNTLRSKPLIPWYELAIKDNNRRSCPQFEVDQGCIYKIVHLLRIVFVQIEFYSNDS